MNDWVRPRYDSSTRTVRVRSVTDAPPLHGPWLREAQSISCGRRTDCPGLIVRRRRWFYKEFYDYG